MIFYKTVCSGNDFIHIELDKADLAGDKSKSELARRICDRHSGAGSDGVVYYRVRENGVDFEVFNQDGSRAELSGNGMAGLSALMFHLNLFRDRVLLNTPVGGRTVEWVEESADSFKLRVEIGVPDFQNSSFFPFLEKGRFKYRYKDIDFFPVSVGNPHAVVFLSSPRSGEDLSAKGEDLSGAPLFPWGANVELVEPIEGNACSVFFYERGVGETRFSSTGSAAVFAVARHLDRNRRNLVVSAGEDKIEICGRDKIYLENYCKIVYKGIYPI